MMKKLLIVFVLMCMCVISIIGLQINNFELINIAKLYPNGTYQFFCGSKQDDNLSYVSVGKGCIVSCNNSQSENLKNKLTDIQGESFSFVEENFDIVQFLEILRAKVVKTQTLGDMTIVYAYNNTLQNYVVENQKINLEIAINGSNITVGYPLILGSY